VAKEWRALVRVVALPRYPFMINYVVATNVERFVCFAFGHTSLRSTAPPYIVLLLAINQSGDVQSPTRWFWS
jgi:hypothetical protein